MFGLLAGMRTAKCCRLGAGTSDRCEARLADVKVAKQCHSVMLTEENQAY